ncbi:tetratricopeptide repeat protein, partial [Streptomyces sp. NPDC059627]
DPGFASAYASRGASLSNLGRQEEALTDLNLALALNPDYSWALAMRARVRRRLGDLPGMREDLRRAAAMDPDAGWLPRELAEADEYDRA